MQVQIVQLPTIHLAALRHTGPYEQLSVKFEHLWNWIETKGISANRAIGIYWDNPEFTPASKLRSAACAEIPAGTQLPDPGGLPIEELDLAPGEYATTRYVGPYESLEPIWAAFTQNIENTLRRQISENPAFEVYLNDPKDTPANQLITELYMPLV